MTLLAALISDQLGTAETSIRRGADVNKAANNGITPLIAAAAEARLKAVNLLLAHGAEPNKADATGLTPLITAVPQSLRGG